MSGTSNPWLTTNPKISPVVANSETSSRQTPPPKSRPSISTSSKNSSHYSKNQKRASTSQSRPQNNRKVRSKSPNSNSRQYSTNFRKSPNTSPTKANQPGRSTGRSKSPNSNSRRSSTSPKSSPQQTLSSIPTTPAILSKNPLAPIINKFHTSTSQLSHRDTVKFTSEFIDSLVKNSTEGPLVEFKSSFPEGDDKILSDPTQFQQLDKRPSSGGKRTILEYYLQFLRSIIALYNTPRESQGVAGTAYLLVGFKDNGDCCGITHSPRDSNVIGRALQKICRPAPLLSITPFIHHNKKISIISIKNGRGTAHGPSKIIFQDPLFAKILPKDTVPLRYCTGSYPVPLQTKISGKYHFTSRAIPNIHLERVKKWFSIPSDNDTREDFQYLKEHIFCIPSVHSFPVIIIPPFKTKVPDSISQNEIDTFIREFGQVLGHLSPQIGMILDFNQHTKLYDTATKTPEQRFSKINLMGSHLLKPLFGSRPKPFWVFANGTSSNEPMFRIWKKNYKEFITNIIKSLVKEYSDFHIVLLCYFDTYQRYFTRVHEIIQSQFDPSMSKNIKTEYSAISMDGKFDFSFEDDDDDETDDQFIPKTYKLSLSQFQTILSLNGPDTSMRLSLPKLALENSNSGMDSSYYPPVEVRNKLKQYFHVAYQEIPIQETYDINYHLYQYYIGGSPSLTLLKHSNQIMTRNYVSKICKEIKSSIMYDISSHPQLTYTLLHQPGSGGDTIAYQIGLQLRNEYPTLIFNNNVKLTSPKVREYVIKLIQEIGHKNATNLPILIIWPEYLPAYYESQIEINSGLLAFQVIWLLIKRDEENSSFSVSKKSKNIKQKRTFYITDQLTSSQIFQLFQFYSGLSGRSEKYTIKGLHQITQFKNSKDLEKQIPKDEQFLLNAQLMAFEEDYKGIRDFVLNSMKKLDPSFQLVLRILGLIEVFCSFRLGIAVPAVLSYLKLSREKFLSKAGRLIKIKVKNNVSYVKLFHYRFSGFILHQQDLYNIMEHYMSIFTHTHSTPENYLTDSWTSILFKNRAGTGGDLNSKFVVQLKRKKTPISQISKIARKLRTLVGSDSIKLDYILFCLLNNVEDPEVSLVSLNEIVRENPNTPSIQNFAIPCYRIFIERDINSNDFEHFQHRISYILKCIAQDSKISKDFAGTVLFHSASHISKLSNALLSSQNDQISEILNNPLLSFPFLDISCSLVDSIFELPFYLDTKWSMHNIYKKMKDYIKNTLFRQPELFVDQNKDEDTRNALRRLHIRRPNPHLNTTYLNEIEMVIKAFPTDNWAYFQWFKVASILHHDDTITKKADFFLDRWLMEEKNSFYYHFKQLLILSRLFILAYNEFSKPLDTQGSLSTNTYLTELNEALAAKSFHRHRFYLYFKSFSYPHWITSLSFAKPEHPQSISCKLDQFTQRFSDIPQYQFQILPKFAPNPSVEDTHKIRKNPSEYIHKTCSFGLSINFGKPATIRFNAFDVIPS